MLWGARNRTLTNHSPQKRLLLSLDQVLTSFAFQVYRLAVAPVPLLCLFDDVKIHIILIYCTHYPIIFHLFLIFF